MTRSTLLQMIITLNIIDTTMFDNFSEASRTLKGTEGKIDQFFFCSID